MRKIKVKNTSRSIKRTGNKFNLKPQTFNSKQYRPIFLWAHLTSQFYKFSLKISGFSVFGHPSKISLVVPE